MRADVVVVGAGPAGMAAALAAADAGCTVALLDAAPAIGGQIHRQPLVARQSAGAQVGPPVPPRLRRVGSSPGITVLAGAAVWQAAPRDGGGARLQVDAPHAPGTPPEVEGDAVVLATGASELVLPFPGWDLPGVLTAGGAQALVKAHGVVPGRRVLVAGTGPLLLTVAAGLARAGAVVAVAEAAPAGRLAALAPRGAAHPAKLAEAAGYLGTLARHGMPLWTGSTLAACQGDEQVERAVLVGTADGRARTPLAVDAVCVSHGFVPALELARALGCADRQHPTRPVATVVVDRDQATTVAGVFAAGEATGVGGAEVAELEGLVAGAAAARWLGRPAPQPGDRLRRRLRRARRFADLLDRAFPVPVGWEERLADHTVVCRCEEVPWGRIRTAVDEGAADVRAVKGTTRCGMGVCQARVCGPVLQLAVHGRTGRPLAAVGDLHTRTVAVPVPLGRLAGLGDSQER
jgi:D-hydroxyproline dehydrogenase subunit alpha